MISFNEAYKIVYNNTKTTNTEYTELDNALNRILAEDVYSDIDMPPFNKSAMDGYACRSCDLAEPLEVVEDIPAGYTPKRKIQKNECAKIMTGSMVPDGADTVIMVEKTELTKDDKVIVKDEKINAKNSQSSQKPGANICYKGEDIKKNEVVLEKGTLIKPAHIAVLATVGKAQLLVFKQPQVGVIATGSELVDPHEKAENAQIRNSNSPQLIGQIKKAGAIPNYYGIVKDNLDDLNSCIGKALSENDVILVTGGVSMGDYDFVPESIKNNGMEILFDKISIKPGKPLTFAVSEEKICFGLPGNPVSTYIQFELLVKPILYKMMEHEYKAHIFKCKLGKDIKRKKAERESIIPVKIENDRVFPIEYHGSAHINSMSATDYIISIPSGVYEIEKGSEIDVRLI